MVNHRQLDTGGRLLLPEKLSTFWKRQNYRTLVKYLVGETEGQERVLESLACHFSSRQEKEPNLMDALKALVEIARKARAQTIFSVDKVFRNAAFGPHHDAKENAHRSLPQLADG